MNITMHRHIMIFMNNHSYDHHGYHHNSWILPYHMMDDYGYQYDPLSMNGNIYECNIQYIVSLPFKMVIFHRYVNVYQRVNHKQSLVITINH